MQKLETKGRDLKLSEGEIEENRKRFLQRISVYRSYGYDQIKSREFIIEKAKPIKGKVLEIATGKGYLTMLLAKETNEIVTVDINEEEQKFAALNAAAEGILDKIKFCVCNAEKLPYPPNSFDLVISVNAFHHFEYPFAILKEMIRACKNKLVIADFSHSGFEIVSEVHKAEGGEHKRLHGDFSIVGAYLKEYDFSVERFEDYHQVVYIAKKKGGE